MIVVTHPHKDFSKELKTLSEQMRAVGGTLVSHKANESPVDVSGASKVISIGGDGTFVSAARMYGTKGMEIFGVNGGNLGFLTPYSLQDIDCLIGSMYKYSTRAFGKVEFGGYQNPFVNDLVYRSNAGVAHFTVKSSGRYLTDFKADGVIISTATGSTGYNLSAGGSIMHPTTRGFQVTPINPIALGARSIIIPEGEISVEFDGVDHIDMLLDGIKQPVWTNVCSTFERDSYLACLPIGYNFYEQLRDKLRWNQ